MYQLEWDKTGDRTFETGIDRCVLYPQSADGTYKNGVAWNGITSYSETPSGAENTALYADNIKYLNLKSAEEFGATIECYTYPPEWKLCDGTMELATGINIGQQARSNFGLCLRTRIGNDVEGDSHGYMLHLVYGCSATPSERSYETVNDSPSAITFSYSISTTPINVDGFRPTSLVLIDSTKVDKDKLKSLEEILYGTAAVMNGETVTTPAVNARLPLPNEIKTMFAAG